MPVSADMLRRLGALGLTMDQVAGVVEIIDAEDEARRASKRDGNRERQARYRSRHENNSLSRVTLSDDALSDVTARDPSPKQRVSPTPPSETQPSTLPPSPPKGGSSPTPTEPDEVEAMAEIYNAAAAEAGWTKGQRMTAQRRSQARRRLVECGGVEGWRAAMARARGSPFLTGDNDRGWRPDFDFFLQAKSFTKLMEGAYDRREGTPGAAGRSARRTSGAGALVSAMADLVFGSDEPGFPTAPAGQQQLDRGAEGDRQGDVLPFGRSSGTGFR